MCGRYLLYSPIEEIYDYYHIDHPNLDWVPRYNIAPTQDALVVINNGQNQIANFKWGLIPHWAKDKSIGNKMINARGETLLEKVSFKDAFRRRRCLIPTNGFYEWFKAGKVKKPYRIGLKESEIFSFAGLWDTWQDLANNVINSFTIITVEPNQLVAPIHDRMPVILAKEDENRWLNPKEEIPNLQLLLKPYPDELMDMYEISTLVNSPVNDFKELIKPIS